MVKTFRVPSNYVEFIKLEEANSHTPATKNVVGKTEEDNMPVIVPEEQPIKNIKEIFEMKFSTDIPNEIVMLRESNKPGLYEFYSVTEKE